MKPGEVLAAKYRLEKRLGFGGMGEVWRATHTGTGREFAIKILHAHAATSPTARQRFSREATASSKINHPSVIDVFDVGETDDGSLYLTMELLDGLTLDDVLHGDAPISVADFLHIMLDAVRALGAAHAVGVVHRDIKPANIFLHRDRATGLYAPKVLDFGISKFAGNEGSATRTGAVVGSPRYMSPEQTRSSADVDPRSDLWSVGIVLFEGLTGTFPHEGDSFSSLVVAICTTPPISIDMMAPHLPEGMRAIIRDCLKPVDMRIRSADEIAARLEVVLQDPSLAQIPLPRPLHPLNEPVRTVTALRIRPATSSRGPSSLPMPPSLGPMSPPLPSGGGQAIANPPSSSGFIPTAQTLPLSEVMQLQEQMQEHLKSQSAARRRGGGTIAMPHASQFVSDALSRTAQSAGVEAAASVAMTQSSGPPVPMAVAPPPAQPAPSGNKLRLLAAVLAVVFIGIVIALVATIRSS